MNIKKEQDEEAAIALAQLTDANRQKRSGDSIDDEIIKKKKK